MSTAYGVRRSLHSAITACLVAQRLAWQPADVERAFKVALTMNLSMLALQGELSRQRTPRPRGTAAGAAIAPDAQRADAAARRRARRREWLRAVLQHHEVEDGSGYPSGRSDVCELASLARRADVYTSSSPRAQHARRCTDAAGRPDLHAGPFAPDRRRRWSRSSASTRPAAWCAWARARRPSSCSAARPGHACGGLLHRHRRPVAGAPVPRRPLPEPGRGIVALRNHHRRAGQRAGRAACRAAEGKATGRRRHAPRRPARCRAASPSAQP
ncbi:MAG: hypothetical protein U1F49_12355 [Rubrivivax sp.]